MATTTNQSVVINVSNQSSSSLYQTSIALLNTSSGIIHEDIVVGTLLLATSVVSVVAHLLMFLGVFRNAQLYRNSCYQIMISLAVSDMLALIGWMFLGVFVITHGRLSSDVAAIVTAMGAWRNSGWHQALLAINRYTIICRRTLHDKLFTGKGVTLMLTVAWLHSVGFAIPTLVSPPGMFVLDGYYILFPHPKISLFYTVEDETVTIILILVACICYTLVIRRYRETVAQVAAHTGATTDQAEMPHKMRLVWQMFTLTLSYTGCAISFYCVQYVTMNMWLAFILNTYYSLINNSISPFIYLTFNKQLQNELLEFWRSCKRRICSLSSLSSTAADAPNAEPTVQKASKNGVSNS